MLICGERARVDDQFGKKTNGSQGHPKNPEPNEQIMANI